MLRLPFSHLKESNDAIVFGVLQAVRAYIRSVKLQILKSQTRVAAIDCVDGFTGVKPQDRLCHLPLRHFDFFFVSVPQ